MKKLVLLILTVISVFFAQAQVSESERNTAIQLVNANKAVIGLSAEDVTNSIVTNTYIITGTDIRMVYLQQSFRGVPVYNQLQVLAFRNGNVVSVAGERISGMEKLANVQSGLPSTTPEQSVLAAMTDRNVIATQPVVRKNQVGNKFEFDRLGVSAEKIFSELIWMPQEDRTIKLAWQVFLAPLNTSDYWLIRVDAQNNQVLGKENLTITCNWDNKKHSVEDHFVNRHFKDESELTNYVNDRQEKQNRWQYKPFVVTSATYRVVKYPAESPWAPGGSYTTHTDPWTMAPGNATTHGWHYDGVTYHDSTRGNNVWAQEDRDNSNATFGLAAVSTTPQPVLTLDFPPDTTQSPILRSPPNQQFQTTNLFYWNNIIHDLSYIYGFDEPSGNFQADNLGRGGLGNDYVIGDAQDAGGLNNANFATPVDGTRPRMQMYLWSFGGSNPLKDGDSDAGIIIHEYTHGISNRLTGGPSTTSCLGNAEQMGEGWSDYFGLMGTHNWATATPSDGFNNPRPIGVYALNGAGLFGPPGIRHFPYCTNMAVNPLVYTATLPTSPHDRGEIWCAVLWDMTWEIINLPGVGINPNLFNPTGGGGNAIALKLVTEGMRLQPCQPGFITGRNAILKADTLFFGAQYSCAIWKAFARRGMGRNASQGLSTSVSDQVPDYTVDNGAMSLTQNAPAIPEGQNIVYTNTISAGECTPMTNFFTTDTLPTIVTWVSGGTYNATNRTVTFSPINLTPGQTQSNVFTVNINAGTYFPPVQHINDPVTSIAPNWTATSTTSNVWTTSGASVRSAPLAFFTPNAAITSDQILRTTNPISLPSNPSAISRLSFWHRYITESSWDGCVVEISTNGGASWSDLGPYMSGAKYNLTLNTSPNPLSGRQAFSGNVGASFVETRIDLKTFAGQTILIRFRLGSDNLIGATGWYIDDILLESGPFVYMKTNLFNASSVLQNSRDTITAILQAVSCDPTIVTQPSDVTTCSGNNVSFNVVATGAPLTYQWELSTDGGTIWNPITGATSNTYNINGVTTAMNGYKYRCVITGCTTATSNVVTLTVNPTPTHSAVMATPASVCSGAGASSTITGTVSGGTITSGVYTHTLTGPGTISQNPPSGPNNSNASFSVTNIPVGTNTYTLTSTDEVGCTSVSTVNVVVAQTPVIVVTPPNPEICAGSIIALNVSTGATQTFSSSTAITIPAGAPTTTSGPANPYPATINVSGLPTSGVTVKSITINGISHTFPDDIDMLLQSPTGTNVVLMSDAGGTNDYINNNFVIDDAAANFFSDGGANPSGTYKPTNYGATDTWVAPGPGSITQANPALSMFTGDMNGTWNLFIVDDVGGDVGSITSWGITFNVAGAVFSPTTGLFMDAGGTIPYPGTPIVGTIYAGPASTTTYTVTSSSGPCVATPVNVTVTVKPNPVHSNVVASPATVCTTTTGATTITGTASGGTPTGNYTHNLTGPGTIVQNPPSGPNNSNASFSVSNIPVGVNTYTFTSTDATGCFVTTTVTVTVGQIPTVVITPSAPQICPAQPVTLTVDSLRTFSSTTSLNIPGTGTGTGTGAPASVYPSVINVSGLPTTGVRVRSVSINGISHTFPDDIDMVLQSPTGVNVILMSDAGGTNDYINNNFVFDDAAASLLSDGGANPSGTYRPTNYGTPDAFPAPGPGSISQTTPALSMFGNTANFNGSWSLYIVDDAAIDVGSMNGWSITFDLVGVGSVTYTWSPSTGLNTTTGPTVIAAPTVTTTYTVTATTPLGCVGTGTVTVTVFNAAITTQPSNIAACAGETRTFTVISTGTGLSYQWQVSTNGGSTWTNMPGEIFPNLTLTNLTVAMNGNQYRVIISGCGPSITSNAATLTVYSPVAITTHPANATVCVGVNVTFSVVATGSPTPLAYQWQISTNGGVTYTNIAGANASTYTLNSVTTALSGNRYRVIVTGYCGTLTSNAAILTVNASTPVTVSPLPARICLSDTMIVLTGTPVGGVWSGVGVIGNNFLPVRTAVGTYTLTYTFTNSFGCVSSASLIAKVEDCPERRRLLRDDAVIVYPNPNSGQFNIRINSTLYSYLGMKVYASNGALVYRQAFTGLQYGRVIPIDLSKLAAGVYQVYIYYDGGVRTSEKTFKIVIAGH